MGNVLTVIEKVTSEEEYRIFLDCYEREYGRNVLSIEFLRGSEEVYLFRDMEGTPIAGYTINTEQAYRTLSWVPAELAADLRAQAEGVVTYELGTIWVDNSRRNGREKLELWQHIFGRMIERADTVMVGSSTSEEIYRFYERYGVTLVHHGVMDDGKGGQTNLWVFYIDDLAKTKVPEMYEQLTRRLGLA